MIKQNNLQQILNTGAGLIMLSVILFPFATGLYLILDKSGSATPESGIAGTVDFNSRKKIFFCFYKI